MDRRIFHYINDLAGQSSFLDQIMIALSRWGIYVFIFLIFFSIFQKKRPQQGIYALLSLPAALTVSRFLKYTILLERPFLTEDMNLLFVKSPSPSFPSDQGVICGLFAVFVWILFPQWRWSAVIFALLVSVSRIYVGHPYPSDAVAGWFIGILCFIALYIFYQKRSN